MEVLDAIFSRRSVRSYLDRNLDESTVTRLLEAVNAAPSAGDLQGYEVVLVRDPSTKDALAQASYGQKFLAEAPIVLVFCADHLLSASKYGKRGAELYSVQDATIAAAYCQLAATALGLASVWVGAFDTPQVAAAVKTPEQVTPVAIIPIGYPAEEPSPTPRRDLNELVRPEHF